MRNVCQDLSMNLFQMFVQDFVLFKFIFKCLCIPTTLVNGICIWFSIPDTIFEGKCFFYVVVPQPACEKTDFHPGKRYMHMILNFRQNH